MVGYLNPADHHPTWITKADKDVAKRLDFKDIKFPVKTKDIHKIEKRNSISTSSFGYENKEKHPIYVSKNVVKKNMWIYLLLKGEGEKKHYVFFKDSNTFMYGHTLPSGR